MSIFAVYLRYTCAWQGSGVFDVIVYASLVRRFSLYVSVLVCFLQTFANKSFKFHNSPPPVVTRYASIQRLQLLQQLELQRQPQCLGIANISICERDRTIRVVDRFRRRSIR